MIASHVIVRHQKEARPSHCLPMEQQAAVVIAPGQVAQVVVPGTAPTPSIALHSRYNPGQASGAGIACAALACATAMGMAATCRSVSII